MSNSPRLTMAKVSSGFSLIELTIAMVITLIITGAMFGLAVSGQTTFRREPVLMDRQQQIRIAMDRIQEDILSAGMGLGPFWQSFGENLGGIGQLGVRPLAGDAVLGSGNADALEIRSLNPDCPQIRTVTPGVVAATTSFGLQAGESVSIWGPPAKPATACYQQPGWVVGMFGDGNAKWGWRLLAAGLDFTSQPVGSQFTSAAELNCSLSLVALGGACIAPATASVPGTVFPTGPMFGALDRVRYEVFANPAVDGGVPDARPRPLAGLT